MPGKNSVITGFVLGMLLPALAWLVFGVLHPEWMALGKPAIPYMVALGLNLALIKVCNVKNADETGKGIMMATFLSMLLLFIFKIKLT